MFRPTAVAAVCLGLGFAPAASAHVAQFPLDGKKLDIRADDSKPRKNKLVFQTSKKQPSLTILHDPTVPLQEMKLFVRASDGSRSELVTLPAEFWKPMGKAEAPKGWKYKDKNGTRGGIKSVQLKSGSLKVKAGGENWTWGPDSTLDDLEVWVGLEEEWFCTSFGGKIQKNEAGYFKAKNADAPATCTDTICGNGVPETGEQCDDGNLDDTDSCTNLCERNCPQTEYESTFEAIQEIVFDGYGCTDSVCHGTATDPAGDLNLLPDVAYANLVNASASAVEGVRVFPIDKNQSFLFEKLAAATFPDEYDTTNSPMPSGGGALTPDHLEAIELWIEGGAPEAGAVVGTAEQLASCLPDPLPLKIDPPAAPPSGEGIQLRSTSWSLPAQSEHEICFATYYDFTETSLIPEERQIDCPGLFGANNPSDLCFQVHRKTLAQDPQSHHSVILVYAGDYSIDNPDPDRNWGPWSYRFDELDNPQNGLTCDPTAVDPATGYHAGCSGEVVPAIACIGAVGPPDFVSGGFGLLENATSYDLHISQEAYYDEEFATGAYKLMPMSGTVAWNSHAFNLTDADATMSQYLNLWIAQPGDDLYEVRQVFGVDEVFTQRVPPFETHEYCHTWTAQQYSQIFRLTSHTHRHGIQWRTWAPPNVPCPSDPVGTDNCGPGPDEQLIYVSTEYGDPAQLRMDPPMALDSANIADRTFRFCSIYDNGSTPTSPPLKRQSTSPVPTGLPFGGPCRDAVVTCANEERKGELCGEQPDPDTFCDTEPGAGDGDCDACPVVGGTTTEDEMFILLGDYFLVEP